MAVRFTKPPTIAVGTEEVNDPWNARTQVISDTVFCRVANNWQFSVGEWLVTSTFTWDGSDPASIALADTTTMVHAEGTLEPYVDIAIQSDGDVELRNELMWVPLGEHDGTHYAVCYHPTGDSSGIGTEAEVPRVRLVKWTTEGGLEVQTKAQAFMPTVTYDHANDWLPGRLYWVDPDYAEGTSKRVIVAEGVWDGFVPYVLVRELFIDLATEAWSEGASNKVYDYSDSTDYADVNDNQPLPMKLDRVGSGFVLRMATLYGGPRFALHFDDALGDATRVDYAPNPGVGDNDGWDTYIHSGTLSGGRYFQLEFGVYKWCMSLYDADGALLSHELYDVDTADHGDLDGTGEVYIRSWNTDEVYALVPNSSADRVVIFRFDIDGSSFTRTLDGFLEKPDDYPDAANEAFWQWAGKWADLGRSIAYTRQVDSSGPDAYELRNLAVVVYVPRSIAPRSINARSGGPRVHFQRPGPGRQM